MTTTTSKAPIFKDPDTQRRFDRDGFLKLQLFEAHDIREVRRVYDKYFPDPPSGFFCINFLEDVQQRLTIADELLPILAPSVERYFCNHEFHGGTPIVKGIGPNSAVPVHHDWAIVDEEKYTLVYLWTPLQEASEENGTLEFLRGSHNWHGGIPRSPTLPYFFLEFQEQIRPRMTPVALGPGEGVVFHPGTIHASGPNLSSETRLAIISCVASKGASFKYYYRDKNFPDSVELFDFGQDARFPMKLDSFMERPTFGQCVKKFDYSVPRVTREEVEQFLAKVSD